MVVAFLLAELAAELGMIEQGVDLNELAQLCVRLRPVTGSSPLSDADEAWDGRAEDLELLDMARHLLLQQSTRGGEVRNLAGVPHRGRPWQEIPAQWFTWAAVLSVPWRQTSHINVYEARARQLALRQRARQAELHHQRFLHLMDSQVNLSVAAKGRSGSRRVSHVQRKSSAVLLACNLRDVNGYTGTKSNPADKASCDRRRWARYRRALALRRKSSSAASTRAATSSGRRRGKGAWPAT